MVRLEVRARRSTGWCPATQTTTIAAVRSKLVPANVAAQFLTRDQAESSYVHAAGDQIIGGAKSFTQPPTVPTPQNATDAANKGYVDANAAQTNLASPPAIGSVTPNAGTFTTLASPNIENVRYADRFPTIQAAINDLPASGGTVIVPQGTYTITSAIVIPTGTQRSLRLQGMNAPRGSTWSGSGCAVKITNNTASANWIEMIATPGTGVAQVTIENLCFDGSSTGDAIHGEANGTNASLSQIEIKGNWINGGNRGIYLTQTGTAGIYHVKVEDNLVFNTASEGIFLNATATGLVSQIQIEKNWVLHFGTASAGLKLHNVQNVAVRNNQVSDSASTVGGIVADNLSASEISGNDVESVNGAGSYAMNLGGYSTSVFGNQCYNDLTCVLLNAANSFWVGPNHSTRGSQSATGRAVWVANGSNNQVSPQTTDYSNEIVDGGAGTNYCASSGSCSFNASLSMQSIRGHEYFVSKYASIQAAIDAAYNNGAVLGGAMVVDDRTSPYTGPGWIVRDSVTLKLAATTYTINGTVQYNNGVKNVVAGIIVDAGISHCRIRHVGQSRHQRQCGEWAECRPDCHLDGGYRDRAERTVVALGQPGKLPHGRQQGEPDRGQLHQPGKHG